MRLGLLWALAVASGAVGALVLYNSVPGINWTAWTVLTIAGLVAVRWPDSATRRAMALPLGFAIVLSVGAGVTTTEPILVAIVAMFVANAYYSSRFAERRMVLAASSARAHNEIGITERQIVLGAAAAISWLFVLLQISYLFGTQPATTGSGITFADYARRGFGELCVAATGVALLIAAAHQRIPSRDQAPLFTASRCMKGLTAIPRRACMLGLT